MSEPQAVGLCECGCGRETRIATYNDHSRGWVQGQPRRFVKGHRSRTTDDYLYLDGTSRHRIVAARALGKPLPVGAIVHHVDDNKMNNAPSNLVICQDDAYHFLLHARARVVRAGGDPNTQRICGVCRVPRDFTDFGRNRTNRLGVDTRCRDCNNADRRERRRAAQAIEMFVVVDHYTMLVGGTVIRTGRRQLKPGDVWDETSGTVHGCNPHDQSRTFCGRLIVGEKGGWFIGEETDEAGRVTCRKCHSFLQRYSR